MRVQEAKPLEPCNVGVEELRITSDRSVILYRREAYGPVIVDVDGAYILAVFDHAYDGILILRQDHFVIIDLFVVI